MKNRICFAAAVLAAATDLAGDPPDPRADWQKKWDTAVKNAAREHASLAKIAWSRKLFAIAFDENTKAAALDPANADAQKGLGKKNEAGVWVDDAKATVKKKDEGKESEIDAGKAALDQKRQPAFEKIVKELEGVGDFAAKNKLADEEKKTWQLLLEYNADHEKARKALGYEKQDGRWVPAEDVAKRNDGKKKIAGADEGKAVEEASDVETKTGWKLSKRRSKNFFFQGPYSDAEMKELIRCAEGARTAFFETFDLKEGDCDTVIDAVFVKTDTEHEKFIDLCAEIKGDKGSFMKTGGYHSYDPVFFECAQGGGNWHYVQDVCAHSTIHELFYLWSQVNANAWLDEGLSYWFTNRLLKSAETHCIEFALSGGGAGGKSWDNVLDWKGLIKQMLQENANPDAGEVMEANINALNAKKGCKAWSLVDYMLTARKKEFMEFIKLLQGGAKQEDAVKQAFGVSGYKDLDEKWKEWVLKNY
ncbi:MAG: hypothetical protein K8T20_01355 [Planctomycetes bacterium]|nr:hypothetical protein [Planctomycetota bacterium]